MQFHRLSTVVTSFLCSSELYQGILRNVSAYPLIGNKRPTRVRKRWIMRSYISRFSFLLLLVLVGLVASSCVMADPPVSANTSNAPTLIQALPDTTDPPTLNVTVTIKEDQNDSDGLTAITVQFSTNEIRNQNFVQFDHGEKVK